MLKTFLYVLKYFNFIIQYYNILYLFFFFVFMLKPAGFNIIHLPPGTTGGIASGEYIIPNLTKPNIINILQFFNSFIW